MNKNKKQIVRSLAQLAASLTLGALLLAIIPYNTSSLGGAQKAQAAGPNDYFYGLVSRPDFWKGYSMRPQAGQPSTSVDYANQLLGPSQGGYKETNVTAPFGVNPVAVSYNPANDTDLHKQDATKFVIPAFFEMPWTLGTSVSATDTVLNIPGVTSTAEIGRQLKLDNEVLTVTARDLTVGTLTVTRGQYGTFAASHAQGTPVFVSSDSLDDNWTMRFPIFSDDGHKYLITWDGYWTDSYLNTGLINHKWTQFSSPSDTGTQSDTRSFLEVGARYDGGATFCCYPPGFNHSTDVAAIQIRSYDALNGPADWTQSNGYQSGPGLITQDPVTPMTNNSFIIKPDVWTRFWIEVDQRANDYDYVDMWVADENHAPVRVYTQLPMSIPPPAAGTSVWNGMHKFWTEFNTSSYTYSRGSMRDLVAYEKNLAILRDPTDVSSLLVQPVGSSGTGGTGTPDTTPPTVSLTNPANGATVSGNVVVSANASDNTAVAAVQFKLDGNNLGTQALYSPYAITWDSSTTTNGTHTLTAVATDTYGNTSTSSPVTITTSNTTVNPTPPPPPPSSGTGQVIGRWSLDEGSGTTAADSSGNNFNGTLTNGPTWTSGHFGSAVSFDGVNDYINVPTSATLNSYPFSVSAWVRTSSTATMGVVNKYVSSSYNGYNLYMSGGHIYAWYMKDINDYVWDGNAGLDGGSINDGNWHHVVFTVDDTGGKLYVDNVFKTALAWKGAGGAPNTTQNLNFGNYASRYFSGSLDDIRIYNYALSATDIANLYNATTTTLVGDLNGDHIVNSIDWSILNSKWYTSDATADLNHDGLVNSLDWSLMNANWLKTG